MKVIDLFSGCGGFSFGFEKAGFEIVLGVDNDEPALSTFKRNHKNSDTLQLDLSEASAIDKIVSHPNCPEIDVIIAGPPCQGFSLTGPRRLFDARNKLFYSVFRLASRLKPKAIVIENVPGLAGLYKGLARDAVIEAFRTHPFAYTVSDKILFAPEYGVPQIRRRLFFVGLLPEFGEFEFPEAIKSESTYVTCRQAISDLPCLTEDFGTEQSKYTSGPLTEYQRRMRNGSKILFNHVATRHTSHVVNVISQVPQGGNHRDLPPGVGDSRRFNEAWTRYHGDKPSKTIDTGHRNHFHYEFNRVPTIREMARLQSFPDDFVFLGSKTQQNRQVGNAVPPLLGYHIAMQLKKALQEERKNAATA